MGGKEGYFNEQDFENDYMYVGEGKGSLSEFINDAYSVN